MNRTRLALAAACLGGLLLADSAAIAQVTPAPKKAKDFTSSLVTAFSPCLAPDRTSPLSLLPACPTTPADTVCQFGAESDGTIRAQVVGSAKSPDPDDKNTQTVRIQAKVKKLPAGCVGVQLCPTISLKFTARACLAPFDGAPCTAFQFANLNLGEDNAAVACCTVDASGGCKIKASLEDILGGDKQLFNGGASTIEIEGLGLARTLTSTFSGNVSTSVRTFASGISAN